MQTPEWSVVNRIFLHAVELAPEERAAYVSAMAAGDAGLQSAVSALLWADHEAGDYLEAPLLPPAELENLLARATNSLQPGTVLQARFRIVRLLGEGGMGRVYEAFDNEFQTAIAIKVIREELLRSPGVVSRFAREAQMARRLSHSNICRVYDFERVTMPGAASDEELCFLTMELLQGENLATYLQRHGALPLADAAAIAHQVAAAIDAAHRQGVTHGDLKPANLVLCGCGPALRVVVTDFGLARVHPLEAARQTEAVATMTDAGVPAGTLAYMAPEQLAGRGLQPSSDMYAFGLVLFELLTGTRPFPDGNPLKGIAARLTEAPPSPRAIRPDLPDGWCFAVSRCLHLQPSKRPATAAGALAFAGQPRRLRAEQLLTGIRSVRGGRWAGWVVATFCVVLVSLLAIGLRFQRQGENVAPLPAGSKLYMPPIQNLTGDARLTGVDEMMRIALAQSPHLTLLEGGETAGILQRMVRSPNSPIDAATAREVAMRGSAGQVVFLSLRRVDHRLELVVDLQRPDRTPSRFRSRQPRTWTCCVQQSSDALIPPDMLHIVRDAADWIRIKAGESSNDVVAINSPVDDITTTNWDALLAFQHADSLQAHSRAADALVELRNAIRYDAGFALAYARLGDILSSMDRVPEGLENYRTALQVGGERRLTRRERNRIRGLYALDSWDFTSAAEAFRDTTLYYDHDFLAWFYRGTSLIHAGEIGPAGESLRQALTIRPHSLSANESLASVQLIEGDTKAALRRIEQLHADGYDANAGRLQAEIAALAGDLSTERQTLEQVTGMKRALMRLLAWRMLVRVAWQQGDTRAAETYAAGYLTEAVRQGEAPAQAEAMLDMAWLQCAARNVKTCLATVSSALQRYNSPGTLRLASEAMRAALRSQPPSNDVRLIRGKLQSMWTGLQVKKAEGRDPAQEGSNLGRTLALAQITGDLRLTEGDAEAALQQYRKAAIADAPFVADYRLRRSLKLLAQWASPARAKPLHDEMERLHAQEPPGMRAYQWFSSVAFAVD